MRKSIFYRLDSQAKHTSSRIGDLEVFRGHESFIADIVRDLYDNSPHELAFYEHYYRNGIEPWIARSNGKIVGIIWLYTGSYLAMWEGYDAWLLNVQFEPTGKFFANVLTDPDSRGKGVFSRIVEKCFAAYPESPFYSCVEVSNSASVLAHEKIGFHRYGVAYYVRFLHKTFCLFRPAKGKSRFLVLQRGQASNVEIS